MNDSILAVNQAEVHQYGFIPNQNALVGVFTHEGVKFSAGSGPPVPFDLDVLITAGEVEVRGVSSDHAAIGDRESPDFVFPGDPQFIEVVSNGMLPSGSEPNSSATDLIPTPHRVRDFSVQPCAQWAAGCDAFAFPRAISTPGASLPRGYILLASAYRALYLDVVNESSSDHLLDGSRLSLANGYLTSNQFLDNDARTTKAFSDDIVRSRIGSPLSENSGFFSRREPAPSALQTFPSVLDAAMTSNCSPVSSEEIGVARASMRFEVARNDDIGSAVGSSDLRHCFTRLEAANYIENGEVNAVPSTSHVVNYTTLRCSGGTVTTVANA